MLLHLKTLFSKIFIYRYFVFYFVFRFGYFVWLRNIPLMFSCFYFIYLQFFSFFFLYFIHQNFIINKSCVLGVAGNTIFQCFHIFKCFWLWCTIDPGYLYEVRSFISFLFYFLFFLFYFIYSFIVWFNSQEIQYFEVEYFWVWVENCWTKF